MFFHTILSSNEVPSLYIVHPRVSLFVAAAFYSMPRDWLSYVECAYKMPHLINKT